LLEDARVPRRDGGGDGLAPSVAGDSVAGAGRSERAGLPDVEQEVPTLASGCRGCKSERESGHSQRNAHNRILAGLGAAAKVALGAGHVDRTALGRATARRVESHGDARSRHRSL